MGTKQIHITVRADVPSMAEMVTHFVGKFHVTGLRYYNEIISKKATPHGR